MISLWFMLYRADRFTVFALLLSSSWTSSWSFEFIVWSFVEFSCECQWFCWWYCGISSTLSILLKESSSRIPVSVIYFHCFSMLFNKLRWGLLVLHVFLFGVGKRSGQLSLTIDSILSMVLVTLDIIRGMHNMFCGGLSPKVSSVGARP